MTRFKSQESIDKALLSACYRGEYERARKLISESGANPNAHDKQNRTALHKAARQGHPAICKLLVENGADVNPVYEEKYSSGVHTPLHDAFWGAREGESRGREIGEAFRYLLSIGGQFLHKERDTVEDYKWSFFSSSSANRLWYVQRPLFEYWLGKKKDEFPSMWGDIYGVKPEHRELVYFLRGLRERAENNSNPSQAEDRALYEKVLDIAERALMMRSYMRSSGQGYGIDSFTLSLLMPVMTSPEKINQLHAVVCKFDFERSMDVSDVVREYVLFIVLPCLLARLKEKYPREAHKIIASYDSEKLQDLMWELHGETAQALFGERGIDTVLGLTAAWHDERNEFPSILRPLRDRGEWRSIVEPRAYVFMEGELKGYRVECLTSSEQLLEEGRHLNHCLRFGNYDLPCMSGDTHIFSVRDPNGQFLSTIELGFRDYGVGLASNREGYRLYERQHRGHGNAEPPAIAQKVWKEFRQKIKAQEIKLYPDNVGETEVSKQKNAEASIPYIIHATGFEPKAEYINAAYNEYKKSKRRAMYYNEESEQFDLQHNSQNFLSGDYRPELGNGRVGNIISLRSEEATAAMWLKATAMDKVIDKKINQIFPELARSSRGWVRQ